MSRWQPIETALKDGTEVLAFIPDPQSFGFRELPDLFEIVYWRPHHAGGGMWVHRGDTHSGVTPTHWMSLPEPPDAAA